MKIEKQAWLCIYDGGKPTLFNYDPSKGSGAAPSLYRVLAGPVTVTFDVPNACPHCGGALPEEQDKAEPPKELVIEASGKYKTRDGRTAYVQYHTPNAQFPWTGLIAGKSATWMDNGWYFDDEESNEDLVERLS